MSNTNNSLQADIFPLVTLAGEAEHGEICRGYLCSSLIELWDIFGEPPNESEGLIFAVQSLLLGKKVLYYRIDEEGFSKEEYDICLKNLDTVIPNNTSLGALFLPKVGSIELIQMSLHVCLRHTGILIMTEKELFDYLTATS